MKKIVNFKSATQLSLVLFSLITVFHLAIIIGIVAFDYVPLEFLWGGRMESRQALLQFEIVSFFVMILCMLIVAIRIQWIKIPALLGASRIALWLLCILFLMNTVGNIMAKSTFEKCFAIVTALLFVLCLRMALEPHRE